MPGRIRIADCLSEHSPPTEVRTTTRVAETPSPHAKHALQQFQLQAKLFQRAHAELRPCSKFAGSSTLTVEQVDATVRATYHLRAQRRGRPARAGRREPCARTAEAAG